MPNLGTKENQAPLNLNGLVGDMEGGKVSKSRGGSGSYIETLQRVYRIVIAEKPQMQSGI